jgi:hypothetical protein
MKRSSILILVSLLLATDSRAAEPAIDVGTAKQLFIDHRFVESKAGSIALRVHTPRRDGRVLIKPDQAWEKRGAITVYSSAMKYKGKFRVWYDTVVPYGKGPYEHHRRVCYAESSDGIHFTKPNLGLHEVNGSKANNVVMPGVIGGCSVWIDPQAQAEHRFKSQAKVYPTRQFHMHSSPDGIHWKLFKRLDPGPGGWDTQSIVFWDKRIARYVMFTRRWVRLKPRITSYRTVRRLESRDFMKWTNQTVAMATDVRDRTLYKTPNKQHPMDFYGADVFVYENVYIMLAQCFWHWQPLPKRSGLAPSTFDVQLAVSRDGVKFSRPTRKPFMRLGPAGHFDSRFVWAMPHPIRVGDELWIYYAGTNRDHDSIIDSKANGKWLSGISRATLRLDGFVSIEAGIEQGHFITPPIRFSGKQLQLNVDAGGGGSVVVTILDNQSRPITGFSGDQAIAVNGNSVRMPVRWKGGSDLSGLIGKTVRLRFDMKNCHLYAFQFVK